MGTDNASVSSPSASSSALTFGTRTRLQARMAGVHVTIYNKDASRSLELGLGITAHVAILDDRTSARIKIEKCKGTAYDHYQESLPLLNSAASAVLFANNVSNDSNVSNVSNSNSKDTSDNNDNHNNNDRNSETKTNRKRNKEKKKIQNTEETDEGGATSEHFMTPFDVLVTYQAQGTV